MYRALGRVMFFKIKTNLGSFPLLTPTFFCFLRQRASTKGYARAFFLGVVFMTFIFQPFFNLRGILVSGGIGFCQLPRPLHIHNINTQPLQAQCTPVGINFYSTSY